MAWSILSAIHKVRDLYVLCTSEEKCVQIIITQYDRDNYVGRLVEVMNDVYSFVQEAEPIKKVESNLKIIELIEQQTTECAYFIRDYAMNKNFCTLISEHHAEGLLIVLQPRDKNTEKQLRIYCWQYDQTLRGQVQRAQNGFARSYESADQHYSLSRLGQLTNPQRVISLNP